MHSLWGKTGRVSWPLKRGSRQRFNSEPDLNNGVVQLAITIINTDNFSGDYDFTQRATVCKQTGICSIPLHGGFLLNFIIPEWLRPKSELTSDALTETHHRFTVQIFRQYKSLLSVLGLRVSILLYFIVILIMISTVFYYFVFLGNFNRVTDISLLVSELGTYLFLMIRTIFNSFLLLFNIPADGFYLYFLSLKFYI